MPRPGTQPALDRSQSLFSGVGAVYCPDEGIADQRATARAYAAAAEKRGASTWNRARSRRRQRILAPSCACRTDDGSKPGGLVHATNYGTNELLRRSRLPQFPLWAMVSRMLMFRAEAAAGRAT